MVHYVYCWYQLPQRSDRHTSMRPVLTGADLEILLYTALLIIEQTGFGEELVVYLSLSSLYN